MEIEGLIFLANYLASNNFSASSSIQFKGEI